MLLILPRLILSVHLVHDFFFFARVGTPAAGAEYDIRSEPGIWDRNQNSLLAQSVAIFVNAGLDRPPHECARKNAAGRGVSGVRTRSGDGGARRTHGEGGVGGR